MKNPFKDLQRYRNDQGSDLDIYVWGVLAENPNDVDLRVSYVNKHTDKVLSIPGKGYMENIIISNDKFDLWYEVDDEFKR